jgi:phage terminase large subunit-like protein
MTTMSTIEIDEERIARWRGDIIAFMSDAYWLENRQPIALEGWQRRLLTCAFAKGADALRRYDLALVGLAKKNGKSTLAGGVALWMLLCDEPNAEVYSIAGDKDQAKIIFGKARRALERSRLLRPMVKLYADEIAVPATESIYRVLAADAPTAHGLNPSCVIADELWQFDTGPGSKGRGLWDALTYSPTRKQPMYWITSYAGASYSSLLYELYERGEGGADPRMFHYWRHDNPASWVTEQYLAQQRSRLPAAVYQRLHENRWVPGSAAAWSKEQVEACVTPGLAYRVQGEAGQDYFVGVDLGLKRDRTAVAVVHRDAEGHIYLDDLRVWEAGQGEAVLIADVEAYLRQVLANFQPCHIACDPWQAASSVQRLKEAGADVSEFVFTAGNLQKLSGNLYHLIANGLVRFPEDRELVKELLEIEAVPASYGWRIDHQARGYSDRVIALGIAAMKCVEAPPPRTFEWVRWVGGDDEPEDAVMREFRARKWR